MRYWEEPNKMQPLDDIMTKLNLTNALLVGVSTEQLSFKMVQKARKGRRLSPNVQTKILNALKAVRPDLNNLRRRDLFRYDMDPKAITAIKSAMAKSKAKKINYPKYVELLTKANVTGYVVDVKSHQITFFGPGGEAYIEQSPSTLDGRCGLYDLEGLKSAIADAQKEVIDYPTFLSRIYAAGILSYDVNCRDLKIKYIGEEHSYKEMIVKAPEVATEPKKAAIKPKKKKVKNKQKSLTRKARLASNKRYFTKKKNRRR